MISKKAKKEKEPTTKETQSEPSKPLEKPKGPEGFVSLEDILVPEASLNSHSNPEKTKQVMDYIHQNEYLDEPILINGNTKELIDGYSTLYCGKRIEN